MERHDKGKKRLMYAALCAQIPQLMLRSFHLVSSRNLYIITYEKLNQYT